MFSRSSFTMPGNVQSGGGSRCPHDAVGAHQRREHGQRVLVDLEADPALPGEVLARQVRISGA